MRNQKKYDREFKLNEVKHYRESGKSMTVISRDFEVPKKGGKISYGKTPWQIFQDAKHLAQRKMLDTLHQVDTVNEVLSVKSSSVYDKKKYKNLQ